MRTALQAMAMSLPLFQLEASPLPPTPSKSKPRQRKIASFNAEALQFPLFCTEIEPETVLADAATQALEAHAYIPQLDDKPDAPLQWSNDGVAQLHSVLLYESLAALAGRGNGDQKREILEWIFEPDYFATVVKNGVPRHIFTYEVAWSFAFCCRLERMDPEVFRDFIRRLLPQGSAVFH